MLIFVSIFLDRQYQLKMKILNIISLGVILTMSDMGKGDNFGTPNSGISFRKLGLIEHSGESYYILADIDVEGLLSTIEPIRKSILKINTNLNNNLEQFNSLKQIRTKKVLQVDKPVEVDRRNVTYTTHNLDYATDALTDSLQEHIKFMIADLLERQMQLENYMVTLGHHITVNENNIARTTRALCDGCGSLISYIFGLTTNEELRNTNEALERMEKLGENTRNIVNLHTSILNTSTIHIQKIQRHVTRITNMLYSVNNDITVIGKHVEHVNQVQFTIVNSLTLTNGLAYASSALNDLTSQFLNLKLGIDQMRKGFLNTHLVPPETILQIIQEIINKNLKALWPATREYIVPMYKYIQVKSLPHNNLSFLIQIPLEGVPSVQLNLYKIIQIPHPVDDKLVINYSNLPKYFSISDDQTLYVEQNQLKSCRSYEELYVCPIDKPIYRTEIVSCALALYKGIENENVCTKHFGPALTRPLVERTDLGWMYSSSFPIDITLICPDITSMVKLPIGSGVLNIPDKCRVTSKHFIIPSSVSTRGTDLVVNVSLVSPFKLKLTKIEWDDIRLLNESNISEQLIAINNDRLPLKGLKNKIDQLKYIESVRKMNMVASSSGVTIGSISFVLVVILFIIMYLFVKTARNNNHNGTGDLRAENLLNQYRKRREEKRLLKLQMQADAEEETPLEDINQSETVMLSHRPLHSSPNSPTPQPRARSNTEVSTLTLPRVSISTPGTCQYHPRPDSL